MAKERNYMFAEYKSKDEYQEAYESVMDKMPYQDQFQLVVFIERLRTTMLTEKEDNNASFTNS